uniref:Uncharacterized protein n=1 Tax=Meloidogyne enterolobii TaxID=390850 RepID=A0A6V7TT04_MELEN|nr:unnamed protein product [Meloidogyne enterolobii]
MLPFRQCSNATDHKENLSKRLKCCMIKHPFQITFHGKQVKMNAYLSKLSKISVLGTPIHKNCKNGFLNLIIISTNNLFKYILAQIYEQNSQKRQNKYLEDNFNKVLGSNDHIIDDFEKFKVLKNKLHLLLKELVSVTDNWSSINLRNEIKIDYDIEIDVVRSKLHSKRLALIITKRRWDQMRQKQQKRILFSLLSKYFVESRFIQLYKIKENQLKMIGV